MDTALIYNPDDTICAVATPQGAGALAVIRLSGPAAFDITDRIWHGARLSAAKSHTAHLGFITDPADGSTVDQAVATIFRAPNSFTGDDTVEFAIHGSRWIQRRLLNLLCAQGARPALPGEYTRRAFASGKMDLAEAEAVADLIAASSEASHRLAMTQMRGHYSQMLNDMREQLLELASLLELELDFSEEDVEFASRQKLMDLAGEIHRRLASLARSFAAGQALKDGIPVAIIGPTNAGKSSLLNALVGDDRAIVSDIHGTTRDIVEDTLEIGSYLFRFKDTAGLRRTDDTIENLGIERSLKAAREASLVLNIIDPTQPAAEHHATDTSDANTIYVVNKTDIAGDIGTLIQTISSLHPDTPVVAISAKTGEGIGALRKAIEDFAARLADTGADAQYTVTNARHAAELSAAADSAAAVVSALQAATPPDLVAQDLRDTIRHLGAITGQISAPEILRSIFQNFCIGK